MKIKYKCLICKKEFLDYKSNKRKYCSIKCKNKSNKGEGNPMYRKKHMKESRKLMSLIQKESLFNKNVVKSKKYNNMTKKEVEKFILKWKNSKLSFTNFIKKEHKGSNILKKIFVKYFLDDYIRQIDELKCHNKKYKEGRLFEYQIMAQKEKNGYLCFRREWSKGPIDIIAIKRNKIELIQSKTSNSMQIKERIDLINRAKQIKAIPIFIKKDKSGIFEIDARKIKSHNSKDDTR